MPELLLPPAQAEFVRRILWTHLPSDVRVSVIGSRATGRRLKPHSDLDLLIDSPVELPLMVMANVREAFAESNLPFSVDLIVRSDASAEFLGQLAQQDMIELRPLPAELRPDVAMIPVHCSGSEPKPTGASVDGRPLQNATDVG